MFCDKCQSFWHDALSKAKIPTTVSNCEEISWARHEAIIHDKISSLEAASDLSCRLCRLVYSTPTDHEHKSLLSDIEAPLHVVLSIDPSRGPLPVLTAEFKEPSGGPSRISRRTVAACSGILNDGEYSLWIERNLTSK